MDSKNKFDPGAMLYGNFINYYQFHPPSDRLDFLPPELWNDININKTGDEPIVCLDIGCNCGDLTESLYEIMKKQTNDRETKILGIDIDNILIERANEKNKFKDNIKYLHVDIMDDASEDVLHDFIKNVKFNRDRTDRNESKTDYNVTNEHHNSNTLSTAAGLRDGNELNNTKYEGLSKTNDSLIKNLRTINLDECQVSDIKYHKTEENLINNESYNELRQVENNKVLQHEIFSDNDNRNSARTNHSNESITKGTVETNDCTIDKTEHSNLKFDIIFCFSITMWIHLNHNDDGLIKFLNLITKKSRYLFIEPQIWRCYRNAQRRITRNGNSEGFKYYKQLKVTSHVDEFINNYLIDNCNAVSIYQSKPNQWNRIINVYKINN